jgi:glycosyltransferase involved in cell wall biosynthesis
MRIWILNHYAVTPGQGSGTRHYDMARWLVQRGHRVVIFASSFDHVSRVERLAPGRLRAEQNVGGVDFVWLRTVAYRTNSSRRIANMLSYAVHALSVQHRYARPDVVIGSSVHPFAGLAAYAIARIRACPFVFEVRDLWPQTLIDLGEMPADSLSARSLRKLERFLYRRAARVVTLLPRAEDYIVRSGIPRSRIAYIPNGVVIADRSESPMGSWYARLQAWRAGASFVAAYIGAHSYVYGLDVLLDAARPLRDRDGGWIGLVLVGDGPEKDRLVRRASRERLSNVLFLDPVPKRQVPALLRSVDAGIVHVRRNRVHRFGISFNKLFDYLASERPIIFACAAVNDPVAESGAGVSIEPDSPEAMAGALALMASTPVEERRAMGERGRAYVRRHHDIPMLADRLASVLEEEITAARTGG